MNEKHLFIVWNNALFCKNRILDNLASKFVINNYFYVDWQDSKFAENIKAFYGIKTNNVERKIRNVGKGKFLVIIANDDNPIYEYRKTYFGEEKVNSKIYDCKALYRKWTGGNFRVHSTQNKAEVEHDLTILFGPNFDQFINKIEKNTTININTVGNYSFDSIDDFKKTLQYVDNSHIEVINDNIYIFNNYRNNINSLLLNKRNVTINSNTYNITIYGENEGDLPRGFIEKYSKDLFNDFLSIENSYKHFLTNRHYTDNDLDNFFNKYSFNKNTETIDTTRPSPLTSFTNELKSRIKYLLCYIKYKD